MADIENPAALPGADRAGIEHAEQRHFTRTPAESQTFLRLRRQRQVERIHRLGARALAELLDEIARHHGLVEDIDRRLAAYAGIDPVLLIAVGGDRFAPAPMRAVGGAP